MITASDRRRDLFTQEGLAVFRQEVIWLLAEQRRTRKARRALAEAKARLEIVESEIGHIMTALKVGSGTVTPKQHWKSLEGIERN